MTKPFLSPGLAGGRLEGTSVPELLWDLGRERRTGVLHVSFEDVEKRVYLQDGCIIFAGSTDPEDRLGELLLRRGRIGVDRLERAVSRLGEGRRLGALLVDDGSITAGELVGAVLAQVERIVLSLFALEEAEYRFQEGPLPTEELVTLDMKTDEILLKGIRRVRSFTRIRRSVGPPRTRYRLRDGLQRRVRELELTDGESSLLRAIGEGQSVEDLCRQVLLSNFEIYQALWAFRVLGVVEPAPRSVEILAGETTLEGNVAEDSVAEVITRLCRAAETGVLHVSRGQVDRSFHIKEGYCVFATSSDLDDGLLAHLMRRGVISLEDREETARRLLSNKRVGTILREMGVLDDAELEAMVREHLGEIVFDTCAWDRGEYAFVPGELPTIEEITLELSLEDLVSRGLARVESWTRIVAGCGGLDARVRLTPSYLEVLDGMEVGQEAWDVLAALREPCRVRDVCRDSRLSDFRTCRVLWAMRILGAVETLAEQTSDVPIRPEPYYGPVPFSEDQVRRDEIGAEELVDGRPAPERIGEPDTPFTVDASALGEPEPPAPDLPREAVESAAADAAEDVDASVSEPSATEVGSWSPWPCSSPEPDGTAEAGEDRGLAAEPEIPAEAGLEEGPEEGDEPGLPVGSPAADSPEPGGEPEPEPEPAEPMAAGGATAPGVEALDRQIGRFNEMQRLLYHNIRAEVGAGAANFVRSCGGSLTGPSGRVFAEVELLSDGAWDPEGLRQALADSSLERPWEALQELLDEEIGRLRTHIGDARARALKETMHSIDPPQDLGHTARPPE